LFLFAALVSRQFVDMARIRIESLLAAFPKLVNTGKQHTYVETENIRYVYQPVESLYLVLVTNKQSNILEDLETLKLLSRILNEYDASEESVSENCFELVFAFDEAISFGHREHVSNLQQIRQNLAMESHEEKLHKMIIQSKINDTKDIMKKKAMEIDKHKLEKKLEAAGQGGGRPGSSSISSSYMGGPSSSDPFSGGSHGGSFMDQQAAPSSYALGGRGGAAAGGPSKGMKLGKKKATLLDTFKDDAPRLGGNGDGATAAEKAAASAHHQPPSNPVSIRVDEKVVCTLQSDGTLENMEVQGNMTLEVHAEESSCIRVATDIDHAAAKALAIQFKTHPNIDKALFNKSSVLGLKDPNRPFPMGSALGVLKWRFSGRDESMVPLMVSCWPSPANGGNDMLVNIEYEMSTDFDDLRNVAIVMPLRCRDEPVVNSCDGDYTVDPRGECLIWSNEIVDDDNRSGSMEVVFPGLGDAEAIYPIEVSFQSNKLFCNVAVQSVTSCQDESQNVRYGLQTMLLAEDYQVVG